MNSLPFIEFHETKSASCAETNEKSSLWPTFSDSVFWYCLNKAGHSFGFSSGQSLLWIHTHILSDFLIYSLKKPPLVVHLHFSHRYLDLPTGSKACRKSHCQTIQKHRIKKCTESNKYQEPKALKARLHKVHSICAKCSLDLRTQSNKVSLFCSHQLKQYFGFIYCSKSFACWMFVCVVCWL